MSPKLVTRLFLAIVATIVLVSALGAQVAQAATPTPTPAPANLRVTTNANDSMAGFVILTVTITNSGQTGSELVSLVADLPAHHWTLSEDNWIEGDCALDGNSLTGSGYIEARHINDSQTDFMNGEASCVVVAQISPCGSYSASPFIIHDGDVIPGNTASWSKGCPTPIPPAPTNTPAPPTPTNTATPAVIVVTTTATPFRLAPLPPNTGSSGPDDGTSILSAFMLAFVALVVAPVSIGVLLAVRKGRMRR